MSLALFAQDDKNIFDVYIYNDEYKIFIRINLYDKDILAPGQEILGNIDGYIGSKQCSQIWPVVCSKIINKNTAEIEVVNNYGSEDFIARLTVNKDGTYILKKNEGSTLKFPVKGKWQKIPSVVVFKKK